MIDIIVAYGHNGAIGENNELLWKPGEMKADMRRFRELTKDQTVIMGRLTLDSIGRALPGRRNIAISRQDTLEIPGVELAHSLEEAYSMAGSDRKFVIGGGQIYTQALASADRIHATEVDADFPHADSFFTGYHDPYWQEASRVAFKKDDDNKYNYEFVTYERN
ncbi:MAG: dihydrofolate reductase [Candidatus Microsaccharimonas sp.]